MEKLPSTNFKNYQEEERYMRAKKKVDNLKGFYVHFASYLIINVFILAMIGFNLNEGQSFWQFGHFSTAFFWGIGIAFHALGVFGKDILLGRKWEERKIQEYIANDKRNWE